MHLGIYRFAGDPQELLPAYDRLMETMPPDGLLFHACIVEPGGIAIFDACPSEEAFRGFSTNPKLAEAFAAAGLPQPTIEDGEVHNALVGDTFRDAAA
jgi:hypothetical protein